jgi:hypothetical protein
MLSIYDIIPTKAQRYAIQAAKTISYLTKPFSVPRAFNIKKIQSLGDFWSAKSNQA